MNRSLARIEAEIARRSGVRCPRAEGKKWLLRWSAAALAGSATTVQALPLYGPAAGSAFVAASSLAAFLGALALVGRDHQPWELLRVADGVDPERVWKVIHGAMAKIERVRVAGEAIGDPETNAHVAKLADSAAEIVRGFEEDPSDIGRSRHFLNTYLGDTATLVERYAALEGRPGDGVEEVMAKVRATLHQIEAAFERQKEINVSDDVEALDIEITVTKRLLEETKG